MADSVAGPLYTYMAANHNGAQSCFFFSGATFMGMVRALLPVSVLALVPLALALAFALALALAFDFSHSRSRSRSRSHVCSYQPHAATHTQAVCGFLYEDEKNIIKEFDDDFTSQMRKVRLPAIDPGQA